MITTTRQDRLLRLRIDKGTMDPNQQATFLFAARHKSGKALIEQVVVRYWWQPASESQTPHIRHAKIVAVHGLGTSSAFGAATIVESSNLLEAGRLFPPRSYRREIDLVASLFVKWTDGVDGVTDYTREPLLLHLL